MKYISYLVFFLFIAALIIFLKNALEPVKEPVFITGTSKCGECHGLKNSGDQITPWKNSKHSGAYTVLFSSKAIEYNKTNGLKAPETEEKCLKCHTTSGYLTDAGTGEYYNINEGVGCEACHGAGSHYSPAEIMKVESAFIRNGGIKGDRETCLNCHNPKGNKEGILSEYSCPFQLYDFDHKTEFEKIKHPLNNKNNKIE